MLQVQDLHYTIGERHLLDSVNFVVQPGTRKALVGPNGAGKTTLLKLIYGMIQPDSGSITKPSSYTLGYLPQEEQEMENGTVVRLVMEGNPELSSIESQMKEVHKKLQETDNPAEKTVHQYSALEHQYAILGGYGAEAEARKILAGLGFSVNSMEQSLDCLSGGWKMRVYLARLLFKKPDLLLLDEPTNHLDLPSLEWLESFLLQYQGSVLFVSHDRYFINRLCQSILEISRGRLTQYQGNYREYEQQKQKNRELIIKQYENQQADRERQERFINRFRYKATKAAQVQSRIKMLEKQEEIQLPDDAVPSINFSISVDTKSYNDVLHISSMDFSYGDNQVLRDVDLDVYRGEKIALVGKNGAGKTTLTKIIAGRLEPDRGVCALGRNTKLGYYAQHRIDALNMESTVLDEVKSTVASTQVPHIRHVLALFQIRGDDVFKKISVLSGGEKARVSLTKILLSPVNFLIMDEPTNHLDVYSKDALAGALKEYDGTLLLISHDRYFLDALVSRVFEIRGRNVKAYRGNYSDYLQKRDDSCHGEPDSRIRKKPAGKTLKQEKQERARARQAVSRQRAELTRKCEDLEKHIEALEKQQKELESAMANPENYTQGSRMAAIQKEYAANKADLENSYDQWGKAHADLDDLLHTIRAV